MARIRNTKKLGQGVDRSYLKRSFPIPAWRVILTAGCLVAGLSWLGIYAVARNQSPYTAGPLTKAHAFLANRCSACHVGGEGAGSTASEGKCLACHDGPIHKAEETFKPACATCHIEHEGIMKLAASSDSGCVSCHGNLQTKSGKHKTTAVNITSFTMHPEFADVAGKKDSTGLKFNHAKHVGDLSRTCASCHVPAAAGAGGMTASPHAPAASKALMKIPTYAETCKECHELTIDAKITEKAPHDQPEVVHKFVVAQFEKYIAANRGDLGKEGAPGFAAGWVKFKTDAAEKKLWGETCVQCHTLTPGSGAADFPSVDPTIISSNWFQKAQFDHSAHQEVQCASCHAAAAGSKVSSELLLPGIAVCRQCHGTGRKTAGSACSTCHVYHDWSKQHGVEGKFKIEELTRLVPHLAPGS